jgi:hypothetical protein
VIAISLDGQAWVMVEAAVAVIGAIAIIYPYAVRF